MTNSFNARTTLKTGDRSYEIWSLAALPRDKVARLPYSLKILLENLLRFEDGVNVTRADIDALLPALKRAAPFLRSQVVHGLRLKFAPELSFQPDHALDYATKIDRLLHQPEVARDLK